jgi:hypothetical protein
MGSHIVVDDSGRVRGLKQWSLCLAVLTCAWVAMSAFLWTHPPGAALVAVAAAGLAALCALGAIIEPRVRFGVALVGAALALSVFWFWPDFTTAACHVASGVALVFFGLSTSAGPAFAHHARERAPRGLSVEGRRFVHGLAWGAVATVPMGVVTLLAMALHLWPLERPVSVLLARGVLGPEVGLPGVLAAVAVAQLAYGALCGGLLTTFAEPVQVSDALGLGLLRWLTTELILLPALGLADFGLGLGLGRGPALIVATAVPHLAYALSLGWLLTRDERRAAVPASQPAHVTR